MVNVKETFDEEEDDEAIEEKQSKLISGDNTRMPKTKERIKMRSEKKERDCSYAHS